MTDTPQDACMDRAARQAVFDVFRVLKMSWSGGLGDDDFMARLYDLKSLESFDSRHEDAAGDIFQHMVLNRDWPDDWPLSDSRFHLDSCADAIFLKFACETLHPAVREDPEEVDRLAPAINEALRGSGWQVAGTRTLGGRPVYRPRRLAMTNAKVYHSEEKEAAYCQTLECRGFTLKNRLGSGAYGVVFRGEQTSLGREVAVKFFDSLVFKDNLSKKRFERESMLMARVEHPSIPYVITRGVVRFSDAEPVPYFVMQYVGGETLQMVLERERPISGAQAAEHIANILSALVSAHSRSVVHRDIKPSNIILRSDRAFLVDFSIGVALQPGVPGLTRATRTGLNVGTTHYAAPEQVQDSSRVDHRADLFSVGVVLAEMLGAAPPVRLELLDAALPDASPPVRDLLRRALAERPEERFESAEAFLAELEDIFHHEGARAASEPATVLCTNTLCLDGQWTESMGYYVGPKIVHDTAASFCAACGERYLRACPRCRAPLAQEVESYLVRKAKGVAGMEAHCGGCGELLFRVPTCQRCGSFLRREDLADESTDKSCQKCWEPPKTTTVVEDFPADDIPF